MQQYMALVGERCPEIAISKLLENEYISEVIPLPADSNVSPYIADHPDTLVCIFDKTLYVHSDYFQKNEKLLSYAAEKGKLSIKAVQCERSSKYPLDCGFNALCLPDLHMLIGRKKSLIEPLKNLCNGDTAQGYAGCCALYAKGHIVTADPSIEKTAKRLGLPVYRISGRDISLPGYSEGFIGGASAYLENTIFLFGDASIGESAKEITVFCQKHNVSVVSLESSPLCDRGGIKFIPLFS